MGRALSSAGLLSVAFVLMVVVALGVALNHALQPGEGTRIRFRIKLPESVHKRPITGRVYVTLSKDPGNRARLQRSLGHQPVMPGRGVPFFAVDIHEQKPGSTVIIDHRHRGYPIRSVRDLEPDHYYAQAILNVYTHCKRADGHEVWVHLDRWDGQHFGWSPGNFISDIRQVTIGDQHALDLSLTEEIPPIELPKDTPWVKRVRFKSDMLSKFWGQPIYLGATVLLPKRYDKHPDVRYPAIYLQGHFDLRAPFGFSTQPGRDSPALREKRRLRNQESGYEFYQAWNSDGFPRMCAILFQHPTPYFDDSYAVNSANNGPYQDAIMKELIPFLEQRFRLIPKGYARVLTGGSTGGYESLALQIHRPKDFGGTWTFSPDSPDFRALFMIDIYRDENAFEVPGYVGLEPERIAVRTRFGQPVQTMRQLSQLALALGSRGRSCDYLEAWFASFGPCGKDGYPKPLWNLQTGKIDREVAHYWRDQGYDLGHYLQKHWSGIGKDLAGKLHIYSGDMDEYYFNLSVLKMQEVLDQTQDPHFGGHIEIGGPLMPHGWHPMNKAELVRLMAAHITKNAPAGENTDAWKHN